jgi:RNA polymerase sigma factor for flagellar operon FliA
MNEPSTVANLEGLSILPETLRKEDWLNCLAEGIDELTVTERLIISMFYYESLTIKEIALVLEMSESEVSRIHYDTVLELLKI